MGLPGDGNRLELTYNFGVDSYEPGTGYGHIAVTVDDGARAVHRPRGRLAALLRPRPGRLPDRAHRALTRDRMAQPTKVAEAVRAHCVERFGEPSRRAEFRVRGVPIEVLKWGPDRHSEGVNLSRSDGANTRRIAAKNTASSSSRASFRRMTKSLDRSRCLGIRMNSSTTDTRSHFKSHFGLRQACERSLFSGRASNSSQYWSSRSGCMSIFSRPSPFTRPNSTLRNARGSTHF